MIEELAVDASAITEPLDLGLRWPSIQPNSKVVVALSHIDRILNVRKVLITHFPLKLAPTVTV